jgi:hypothetical protein
MLASVEKPKGASMIADPVTEPASAATCEEGVVRAWRFEEFRRLGFATATALRLVDSDAELSLARRLVGLGCPLQVAHAILE